MHRGKGEDGEDEGGRGNKGRHELFLDIWEILAFPSLAGGADILHLFRMCSYGC